MHIFICCLSAVYLLFVWAYSLSVLIIYNKQIQITIPDLSFAFCGIVGCKRDVQICCENGSCTAIDDVVGDRHVNVCADVRVDLSLI